MAAVDDDCVVLPGQEVVEAAGAAGTAVRVDDRAV